MVACGFDCGSLIVIIRPQYPAIRSVLRYVLPDGALASIENFWLRANCIHF